MMMRYYPAFLRVADRPCLIVGGGAVAERRVVGLVRAGARVTVVSPRLTAALTAMAESGEIVHHARRYAAGDLRGFWLVVAATGDEALHAAIAREAETQPVLLNVADRAELCSFIAPAVIEQGELTIAISTNGTSPALARRIREQLAELFGPEWAETLAILGAVRRQLQRESRPAVERQRILRALAQSDLPRWVRTHQPAEVDRLLSTTVGGGMSMASLGVELD